MKYFVNMYPSRRRTDRNDQNENEDERVEARAASFTLHTDIIFAVFLKAFQAI
jgi:hypothetical protein